MSMEFIQYGLGRWVHIMAGVMWIGLLYYFNFVQVDALKKAIADNDISGMKSKTEDLQKVFAEAYQQMAQAGAAPDMGGAGAPEAGAGSSGSDAAKDQGQVVDADFEVVDSDKKA